MTPDQTGMYIGGDWGSGGVYANPLPPEPLDAVLAGSASGAAASWAQFLKGGVVNSGALGIINDALGEARGASPIDYSTTSPPLFYVAGGTRNAYARSSWAKTGFWKRPHLGATTRPRPPAPRLVELRLHARDRTISSSTRLRTARSRRSRATR